MSEKIITIKASDYKTRTDLENYVRNKHGLTPEKKATIEISGTRKELGTLGLSDRSVFWGISCVITDNPTKAVKTEKPNRGEVKDFGINKVKSFKKTKKI